MPSSTKLLGSRSLRESAIDESNAACFKRRAEILCYSLPANGQIFR